MLCMVPASFAFVFHYNLETVPKWTRTPGSHRKNTSLREAPEHTDFKVARIYSRGCLISSLVLFLIELLEAERETSGNFGLFELRLCIMPVAEMVLSFFANTSPSVALVYPYSIPGR